MYIYIIYIPLNFKPILSYSVTLEFLIELLRSSDPWVLHSEPYPGAGGKMGLSYWSHYICFFPECGAKGSRLTVGVWGRGVCSLAVSACDRATAPWQGRWGTLRKGVRGGERGFGFADLSCFHRIDQSMPNLRLAMSQCPFMFEALKHGRPF